MSSQLFKELADKGMVEKLETALSLSNILYARSKDSSSQEAFLSTIVDLLQESIDYLKGDSPRPLSAKPKPEEYKYVEIKNSTARNPAVCPCPLYQSCDKCKKFEPRTKRTWTAEQKAEHSAHLKGLWAAKKAFKATMEGHLTIPL
jgi:hypothetical protein